MNDAHQSTCASLELHQAVQLSKLRAKTVVDHLNQIRVSYVYQAALNYLRDKIIFSPRRNPTEESIIAEDVSIQETPQHSSLQHAITNVLSWRLQNPYSVITFTIKGLRCSAVGLIQILCSNLQFAAVGAHRQIGKAVRYPQTTK